MRFFFGALTVQGADEPKHPGAYIGYTLIATNGSPNAYLIDIDGTIVHTWQTPAAPASSTYFLDSGTLLRTLGPAAGGGRGRGAATRPTGAAAGARIQEIAWDGTPLWDFDYETPTQAPHHDAVKLPNGNYLFISWDKKTPDQCIAAGRKPEYQATGELPPDCIFEVQPTGTSGGKIVWEWHIWDHLVQDFDKDKPNYADPAKHPELIDINYSESWMDAPAAGRGAGPAAGPRGGAGAFGGGGGGGGAGRLGTTDWTHLNAIAYNPELDQILVSSYTFSEVWIIDHSTTTQQAKSHAGGKSGKGGDLLYRLGNPAAYRAGTNDDQLAFCQHNAHWIPKGLNGEGHVLLFNNGPNRPSGERYSEVDEFQLPVDKNGNHSHVFHPVRARHLCLGADRFFGLVV